MSKDIQQEQGFTLIEVVIVLTVGAILLATLSRNVTQFIDTNRIEETQQKLDVINDAIQNYRIVNGKYPCPARTDIGPANVNFLREAAFDCAVAPAAGLVTTAGAPAVRIGSLPTRSLNLPDDMAFDAWNSRFRYAVTQVLADNSHAGNATPAAPDNDFAGGNLITGISIIGQAGGPVINPANGGHYIVISHGPDRTGALTFESNATSTPILPCPAAGAQLDQENCDNDATFRQTLVNSSLPGATYYDDHIRFTAGDTTAAQTIPQGAVIAFNRPCPAPEWTALPNSAGRIVVGAGNPALTGVFTNAFVLNSVGGDLRGRNHRHAVPDHEHTLDLERARTNLGGGPDTVYVPAASADGTGPETINTGGTTSAPDETQEVGRTMGAGDEAEALPPYVALNLCVKV